MALLNGGNIANIDRVKIETLGASAKTYVFETSTSASFTAVVEEGSETTLRIKNTIHGLIKTETLTKGYDIEIQDQKLNMEIYALIDGGTYTPGSGEDGEHYAAPIAGNPVTRTKFNLTLYTSDRDTDGSTVAYHAWSFPSCTGKPVEGSFKDQEFATNSYKVESRAPSGAPAMTFERIAELPAVV